MDWFNDEWFWKTYGPIMFDEERMASSGTEVERIIDICNLQPGAEVFDCCCGMGRHALEFAQRGFKTMGLDLSSGYIDIATRETEKRGLQANWLLQDARQINFENQFDLITNMFTSFGYFDDPEDDLLLLKKIHQALKPGGSFFMEVFGKEVIAKNFEERTWFEREKDNKIIKILLEYSIDLNWTELHNRWLFIEDEKLTEYKFHHRIFSAAELSQLLWQAGFENIDIYGDFNKAPYDPNATHLILHARK